MQTKTLRNSLQTRDKENVRKQQRLCLFVQATKAYDHSDFVAV